MPTPSTSDLPKPKSWDEFEDIVWEIYMRKWQDSHAQRYGRNGQRQNGVDIYIKQNNSDSYVAVQCKRYEDGKLSKKIIEDEVAKAGSFTPPISEYIIATTESRDTKIQDSVRELNEKYKSENKFLVYVVFWEDICNDLATPSNHDLLKKYYSEWERIFQISETISLQEANKNYLKQLRNYFDDVTFAGIDLEEQGINQPRMLANIFVMPDVEEEVSENYRNELQGQEQQVHQSQRGKKSGQKIPAKQLFKDEQTRRVLLLGTPGSGKTTLVNYFILALCGQKSDSKPEFPDEMLDLAYDRQKTRPSNIRLSNDTDWLPIVIRIRELARHLDMSILDFARYFAEKHLSCSPLPHNFFEYWLEDGRAFIFFDGLDEVEKNQQPKIVERIRAFLEKYAQNRAIITSRPVGNPVHYFQTKEFTRYSIQPFNNGQIAHFIHRWYNSHCLNQTEAERRKTNLKKALFGNEHVKLLAGNPLLLTIILLIHREQAQLPKERRELYDSAINTLLHSWDKHKELNNYEVLQYLKQDDLRWFMARLAYWMHTQGGLGHKEGGMLIERDTLLEQLSEYIQDELGVKLREAEAEAKRFLDRIVRERAGLISDLGDGYYAFVHRTFQEYLTAEDICNRAKEQREIEPLLKEIHSHLHNPHWHEVILLLVAQLNGNKAAKVIKTILNNNSEYEQWLYRDLLLAGRCLAEYPKWLRQKEENAKLVTEILTRLVKLETTDGLRVGRKTKQLIPEILLNLSGTIFAEEAIQLIKYYASPINDSNRILMYRLALGDHQEAVTNIFHLLKNKYFFERTLNMLNKVVKYSNISDFLIQQLCSEFHGELGIAKGLRQLGYHDEYVDLTLIDDDYDEYWNDMASEAHLQGEIEEAASIYSKIETLLSELRNNSEAAIDKLLRDWLDYEDYGVGEYVAKKLGEASSTYRLIELKLLEKLQDKSFWEYGNTILALGYLINPSQDIIDTLVSLLQNHEDKIDKIVCVSAAKALIQLDIYHKLVLSQLLKLLSNPNIFDDFYEQDLSFNSQVFEALVQLGKTFDGVAPALSQWIEQHQDKEYLVDGIDALWTLVEGSTTSYER